MRFITSAILALVAISSTVVAVNPNAFINPAGGAVLQAGETTVVTWTPGSPGTVTLKLRKGPSTSLSPGEVIADRIPNSGSFSWAIPKDIPAGSDYALSITDDTGTVEVNYTGLFSINSDAPSIVTTTSSGTATSGATSSTSTYTKPHNSTMTTITSRSRNATTTGYSNATATVSTVEVTSEPTETETDAESQPTSVETSTGPSSSSTTSPTSGAISLLNSPLALVVCVLGAVFYLN